MDTQTADHQDGQFHFSGETGEYFRIWIVNMALTIVTLGIYSAWATVRKKRYFYTHTTLAGGNFDYHANPKAILIGRAIAVLMLLAYYVSSYLHQLAPFAVILLVLALVPWFVVRSRRFQSRVTSYRGVRFNFTGGYAEAFKTYYLAALISVLSLGLATARANHMRARFIVSNSAYGQTNFGFGASLNTYYSYFWRSVGLTFLVGIGYAFATAGIASTLDAPAPGQQPGVIHLALLYAQLVLLMAGYAAVGVYYQVRIRNHLFNTTTLGKSELVSSLEVSTMLGLYLTNLLAIVFSFGLAIPWAQIRMARYRADSTTASLADNWQTFVAAQSDAGTAIGDELGEAFDVDVGLSF
jgi:uncharacterized membrane protein YjgN (DUF898 family)